jgi:hypothetical protein
MKKLPTIAVLKQEIETAKVSRAIDFLKSKSVDLAKFEDVEDFVFQVDFDHPPTNLRGVDFNFRVVRAALAKTLWSRGLFYWLVRSG